MTRYTVEVQTLAGTWGVCGKLQTWNGAAWLVDTYATVQEARAAAEEAFPDRYPEGIDKATFRIVADVVDSEDYEDFDDYCAALRRLISRSPAQQLTLIEQEIACGEEHRAEAMTQYRSECALFGDAGPGQWHAACDTTLISEAYRKRATLKRICNNLGA